jgi:hypothetical protein
MKDRLYHMTAPTERLREALNPNLCIWSPWDVFTKSCGSTPPDKFTITEQEFNFLVDNLKEHEILPR